MALEEMAGAKEVEGVEVTLLQVCADRGAPFHRPAVAHNCAHARLEWLHDRSCRANAASRECLAGKSHVPVRLPVSADLPDARRRSLRSCPRRY